jgi:hypothetical protein
LIDVFFEGHGFWSEVDDDPYDPCLGVSTTRKLEPTGFTSGVFSLTKQDEIRFRLNPDFKKKTAFLLPSEHQDSKFKTLLNAGVIDFDYDLIEEGDSVKLVAVDNGLYYMFTIDTNQPFDLFPAKPCQQIKDKKTTVTEGEREILYKLIIGMAMHGYNYDPKSPKNKATGYGPQSIMAKIATCGITVSDDAIRNYLNEAKNYLGLAKP